VDEADVIVESVEAVVDDPDEDDEDAVEDAVSALPVAARAAATPSM
jgi:hypothetical protein